jgi:hypothetical protein
MFDLIARLLKQFMDSPEWLRAALKALADWFEKYAKTTTPKWDDFAALVVKTVVNSDELWLQFLALLKLVVPAEEKQAAVDDLASKVGAASGVEPAVVSSILARIVK